MTLFGLFGTKPKENVDMISELTEKVQGEENEGAISPEKEKHLITITWGTGILHHIVLLPYIP